MNITENTTLGDLKILLGQLGVRGLRLEIVDGRRLVAIFHPDYGHHVHAAYTEADAIDGAVDKLKLAIGAAHAETLP